MMDNENNVNNNQESFQTAFVNWYLSIPFTTRFFGVVIFSVYIGTLFGLISIFSFCLQPLYIFNFKEIHRIFAYQFVHSGFFHILMNSITLITWVGPKLEKNLFGSFLFFYLNVLFCILTSIFHILITYTVSYLTQTILNECSMGYSGVLFGFITIYANQIIPSSQPMTVCFFRVSNKVYPWVLLLFCQLFFPNVSFIGHLSGIIAGQLYVSNYLNSIIPSISTIQIIESSQNFIMKYITSSSGYILQQSLGVHFILPSSPSHSASHPPSSSSSGAMSTTEKLKNWLFAENVADQGADNSPQPPPSNVASPFTIRPIEVFFLSFKF